MISYQAIMANIYAAWETETWRLAQHEKQLPCPRQGLVWDRMRERSLLNPGYQLPNLADCSRMALEACLILFQAQSKLQGSVRKRGKSRHPVVSHCHQEPFTASPDMKADLPDPRGFVV